MNRPDKADVAVVIPTYNHAHFLARAIDSVWGQTLAPSEVIVVDDGSSDEPGAVVSTFPGVRLIRQANRGLASARNTGLIASQAAHLLFLDADDRLRPEAIRYGCGLLAADPEAAFAYGAYEILTERGARPVPFLPAPRDAFAAFLRENLIGMHATVLYRRGPLKAVGGFREALRACEDYDLYLRLSRLYPVACGPEVVAEYWHHGGNMSSNSALMLRSVLSALGDRRDDAERAGVLADYELGRAQWKRYYSSMWVGAIRRQRDARLIRQGFAMAGMAPRQLAGVLWRGLRQ